MLKKKMVCLAYSRKPPGICVAGKDIETGEWIRPVKNEEGGALDPNDTRYPDGNLPELLDIIEIAFEKNVAKTFQPENKLIAAGQWKKTGRYDISQIARLLDNHKELFRNSKYSSSLKYEDIIKDPIGYSLCLITPEKLKFTFSRDEDKKKDKVRAVFQYKGCGYDLSVTDIVFESLMKSTAHGDSLPISNPENYFFCVSLGEPWKKEEGKDEYCYKLVAGVVKA